MRVTVNGEVKEFREGATLQQIMEKLGIAEKVMAAAVNMDVVKKERWGSFSPKDGDRVELLHFVGGG
ncbi:hypothetical protein NNO_0861 [Hydrogenimonas sp.]|nr:hypothetical protein NNO_0861 [Hydrogenimonas sp.]